MLTHHPTSNPWRHGVLICLVALVFLLATAAGAALIIEESDFNDQTDEGWQGFGVRPPGPQIVSPGPSGDPDDFYYQVVDRASVGNIPGLNILAPTGFSGDYSTVADTCGHLEFDLRVFDDQNGELTLRLAFASDPDGFLQGADPQIRARFLVTEKVDEGDGWVHVTIPLARLDNGMLPSNAQGTWEMTGSSTTSQWNALLASVDHVYIPLEINSGTFETVGIDNVALVTGVCPCPYKPNRTQPGGVADEFSLPADPARRVGFDLLQPPVGWKTFDDTRIDRWLGHTFVALPTAVIGGELEIRMKPELFGQAFNDSVALGFDGMSFLQSESIVNLPEAGGTWSGSSNGPTTFVIPLSQAVLDKIASTRRLEMLVQDDTTVDHAILRLIQCPPPTNTGGSILDPRSSNPDPNLLGGWTVSGGLIEFQIPTPDAQGNCVEVGEETCLGLGNALTLAASGTVSDLESGGRSIGTLTFSPHPDGVGLTVGFDDTGKSTTKVVEGRGGSTVVSDYGDNGLVAVIPEGTCISEVDYIDNGCFRAFFVGAAVEVNLTRSASMGMGNGVEICPDVIVGQRSPVRFDTFGVTAEGFDELRVAGISVQQFDVFSRAFGEATITTTSDSVVLSNLLGGDDGLAVSFNDVNAARLEWGPLEPSPTDVILGVPGYTFVEVEARGRDGSGDEISVGKFRMTYGSEWELLELNSATSTAPVSDLEVRDSGRFVATVEFTEDSDVSAFDAPTVFTAQALDDSPLGLSLAWSTSTTLKIDGVEYTGDEIRVAAPGTSGADIDITELVVTAGGLEDITFTDISFGGEDACIEDAERVCLQQDRFQVDVSWTDFSGNSGTGRAVPVTSDTGAFWFFGPENIEVVVKVLDGRDLNDHFWVFYGALSNVEYQLRVTDTTTGATRTYFNPSGDFASFGDTAAFTADGRAGAGVSSAHGLALGNLSWQQDLSAFDGADAKMQAKMACVAGPTNLCLNQDRFRVEVEWEDFAGSTGSGAAVPLTSDAGYFWFFGPDNVEVVIKVLDGRTFNGNFWVFYGALSNVGYRLTITDTVTGTVKTYDNPLGSFGSRGDVAPFGS